MTSSLAVQGLRLTFSGKLRRGISSSILAFSMILTTVGPQPARAQVFKNTDSTGIPIIDGKLGRQSFGPWAISTFVDAPEVQIGKSVLLWREETKGMVAAVQKLLDTKETLDTITGFYRNPGYSPSRFEQAVGVSYCMDAVLTDRSFFAERSRAIQTARMTLTDIVKGAGRHHFSVRDAIAAICLVRLSPDRARRLDLYKWVVANSKGANDCFGLSATVGLCFELLLNKEFESAQQTASAGLKRYALLTHWTNFHLLKLISQYPHAEELPQLGYWRKLNYDAVEGLRPYLAGRKAFGLPR